MPAWNVATASAQPGPAVSVERHSLYAVKSAAESGGDEAAVPAGTQTGTVEPVTFFASQSARRATCWYAHRKVLWHL